MSEPEDNREGKVIIEYENLDLPPAYVESVQGMPSPQGVLHVSFFSERIGGLHKLEGQAEFKSNDQGKKGMSLGVGDPFGLDGRSVRMIRRVEANLVFTPKALKALIPWLQQQLESLQDTGDET